MDAGEVVCVTLDLVVQVRRVPEVPHVELDPERGRVSRVADQLDRFGDRGDERPLLAVSHLSHFLVSLRFFGRLVHKVL